MQKNSLSAIIQFVCVLCAYTWADLSSDLEQATGNRTKIVFAKCLIGDGNLDLTTPDYSLAGFDSYRGQFFEIVSGPRYCAHPLITPHGEAVLFSDLDKKVVYTAPWCGTTPRVLCDGYALCVLSDTVSNVDWVYVSDSAYGSCIYRYDLADITKKELVWNKTPVSIRFNVSADGRFGGGEFPWSKAGEISLPNGDFFQFGSGCNTNIAPDNSYRLFHMDGNHKSIWMYDSGGTNKREIRFTNAPDINGNPSWIPRWSNDVRFFTLTAPCATSQPKTYKEDIYFGCFNETYDSVKQWIHITNTADTLENYAYAWIGREYYVRLDKYEIRLSRGSVTPDKLSENIVVSSVSGISQDCSLTTNQSWLHTEKISQNGTCIVNNSIDTTISMLPGAYSAIVTIHCQGYADESYRVDYNIGKDRSPTALSIGPKLSRISQYDSVGFKGICQDKFKSVISVPLVWSLSGGGSIDSTGKFKSNGDTGTFTVRAWVQIDSSIADSTTISIYENPHILQPNKQTIIHPGDSLTVQWVSHMSLFKNLLVYLSTNNGRSWQLLNSIHAIYPEYDSSGRFSWLIPQSVCDDKKGGGLDNCLIKITDYDNEIVIISDEPFRIACSDENIIVTKNNGISKKALRYSFLHGFNSDESVTITMLNLTGKIVDKYEGLVCNTGIRPLPKGMYLARVASLKKVVNKVYVVW